MANQAPARDDGPSTMMIIREARILWPNGLFELPVINGQQTDKYGCKFILEPNGRHKEAVALLKKNMKAMADYYLGGQIPTNQNYLCLAPNGFEIEGEDDLLELRAKNKVRPHVVGKNPRERVEADEGKTLLYNGARVNCKIDLWVQKNKWGTGIHANLHVVQFVRDDTALTGGRLGFDQAIEGFEDVEGSDTDLDFL